MIEPTNIERPVICRIWQDGAVRLISTGNPLATVFKLDKLPDKTATALRKWLQEINGE